MNHPSEADCDGFVQIAIDGFQHLREAFQLAHVSPRVILPECSVEFRNRDVGVTVFWEVGGRVWVELSRWIDGKKAERSSLEILLRLRTPEETYDSSDIVAEDELRNAVHKKQALLCEWATDILRGDFSVFPQLQKLEDENLKRRNRELYGEENGGEIFGDTITKSEGGW